MGCETKDRFTVEYPQKPAKIRKTEWEARLHLAACYRIIDLHSWTSIVYNHITLRVPDTDHFLINPFGLRYDEVRASDLIVVDIEGNSISKTNWPLNKAGYNIHSAIHRSRPDLHCIIHTHEVVSQALCSLDYPFIPVTQEGCQFHERVGYHEFKGIVLDASEGPEIAKAMGNKNHTLILKNHGLITAGSTCALAFVRHYAFIRNAEVQLAAMGAGQLSFIDRSTLAKTRDQFESGSAQGGAKERHPEWPALIRKIDQVDPSWKY